MSAKETDGQEKGRRGWIWRHPLELTLCAILLAMTAVTFAQVVARYVFEAPLSWSEELARYLQVWLIMLGSAVCLRKGLHLTVDYAVHSLPSSAKRTLRLVSLAAIIFFLGVVFVSGVLLIAATVSQRTPALQVPIWVVYLAIPVGSFLMLLESVELVLAEFDAGTSPVAGAP